MLAAACRATGIEARLELVSPGSLFRLLRGQRDHPRVDMAMSLGPYLPEASAREGLLEPHRPSRWPGDALGDQASAMRESEWRWVALDFLPFRLIGAPPVESVEELSGSAVPRLAMPDPLRHESGLMALLVTRDRFRHEHRTDVGPESGWDWWLQRAHVGLELTEDAVGAVAAVRTGRATHALVLGAPEDGTSQAVPVQGLAPVPNAVALVKGAPHADSARTLLDWLVGPDGAAVVNDLGSLSPWHADANGLRRLAQTAPPLDVGWTLQRARATRTDWASRVLS
jgi:ABC-type Fe3+ transport system substrate-binding protein